jgi:hypothetical protein
MRRVVAATAPEPALVPAARAMLQILVDNAAAHRTGTRSDAE